MPKLKGKLIQDGTPTEQTVEVDVPDDAALTPEMVSQRYISKDKLGTEYMPRATFDAELERRTEGKIASKLEDENFLKGLDKSTRQRAMKLWGVNGGEAPQDVAEAVAQARKEWEAEQLEPLANKVGELEKGIGSERERRLVGDILAAAAPYAKDALLKRPNPNKPMGPGNYPPVVTMYKDRFGFDEKHADFAVRDGDGFAFSTTGDRPYKGVGEFFEAWASDDATKAAGFVRDDRPRGPGLGDAGGSGGGGVIKITRDEARDNRKYTAAQEQAEKAGAELVVEG